MEKPHSAVLGSEQLTNFPLCPTNSPHKSSNPDFSQRKLKGQSILCMISSISSMDSWTNCISNSPKQKEPRSFFQCGLMPSSGAKLESQISGVSNLASEEGDENLKFTFLPPVKNRDRRKYSCASGLRPFYFSLPISYQQREHPFPKRACN